jgi:hypothetical protein
MSRVSIWRLHRSQSFACQWTDESETLDCVTCEGQAGSVFAKTVSLFVDSHIDSAVDQAKCAYQTNDTTTNDGELRRVLYSHCSVNFRARAI